MRDDIAVHALPGSADWTQQRTMHPVEYQRACEQLQLTGAAAARLLGISARGERRYRRGQAVIPPAQVLLLRALVILGSKPFVPKSGRKLIIDKQLQSQD